jgi:hypothetical protein
MSDRTGEPGGFGEWLNPKTEVPTTENTKFHEKERIRGIYQPTPFVVGPQSDNLFNFSAFRDFRGSFFGIRAELWLGGSGRRGRFAA